MWIELTTQPELHLYVWIACHGLGLRLFDAFLSAQVKWGEIEMGRETERG
jgi:hypothetical protein